MEENAIHASGFVIQPRLRFKHLRDRMIYQHLVMNASYKATGNLQIGQTIIVMAELEKELDWTSRKIKTSLERLAEKQLIIFKTLPHKRGLLITVIGYESLQKLGSYTKKTEKNVDENVDEDVDEDVDVENDDKPCRSRVEGAHESENVDGNVDEDVDEDVNLISITAFINSINNINKTLKEYIVEAPVKNKNLSSTEDIETFVDFALRTNAFPDGVSRKILINYFDCIRLTRQTCHISANILVKLIDRMSKYSADKINYALWTHFEKHDDKRESYTLGILRGTQEHEARRGLIKLKNMNGGVDHEVVRSGDEPKYDYGF